MTKADIINEISDDFLERGYDGLEIDADDKTKKNLRYFIPIARDEIKNEKTNLKRASDISLKSVGIIPFFYGAGYLISNALYFDPLYGSAVFGTSSLAAFLVGAGLEKYDKRKTINYMNKKEKAIDMLENALEAN